MSSGTTKRSFVELIPEGDSPRRAPGAIFIAPIYFYSVINAIFRPQPGSDGRIKYNKNGTATGAVYMDPKTFPPDAFLLPEKVWAPEGAEFVLQTMKYRPVVVISPERANTRQSVVVPMYTLHPDQKFFNDVALEQLKSYKLTSHVFVPGEEGTPIHDSFLDLARVQAIANNDMTLHTKPCRLTADGLSMLKKKLTEEFLFT